MDSEIKPSQKRGSDKVQSFFYEKKNMILRAKLAEIKEKLKETLRIIKDD